MIAATYNCGCPPKSLLHSAPMKSSQLPTQLPQLYSQSMFLPQSPQNCCPSKIQKSYQPFNQISSQREYQDYSSPARHSALYPPCTPLPAYSKSNFESNTRYQASPPCPASTLSPNTITNQVPGCICLAANQMNQESNEVCEDACPGVTEGTASKVVSEIVNSGLPYKEIEAIINDNRMVIRMQKDPVEDEFDPPCDCNNPNPARSKRRDGGEENAGNQYGNNVVFQMASAEPTAAHIDQNTILKQACDQSAVGCRTVTVFPEVDVTPTVPTVPTAREDEKKERKDKIDKPKVPRAIDLEENPNIFILRIRKKSDNGERKTNIDLEFRTPRPWRKESKPTKQAATEEPHKKDTEKDTKENNDKGKKTGKGKDKGKKKKK